MSVLLPDDVAPATFDVVAAVRQFVEDYQVVAPVGVAVSGGGDSLALCHALCQVFEPKDVIAIHVDHGLQNNSQNVANQVVSQLAEWGVDCVLKQWQKPENDAGNVHQQARYARYGLIDSAAQERGLNGVFTGHTQDDVLEGFFMRLNRGSGLTGLCGPHVVGNIGGLTTWRPLLAAPREALRTYLQSHNMGWYDDPANENDQFYRARARKMLNTWREQGLDEQAVVASIRSLQRAEGALGELTAQLAEYYVVPQEGGVLMRDSFMAEPLEVALRLLQLAIVQVTSNPRLPRTSKQLDLLQRLLANEQPTTLGGARFAATSGGFLVTLA